MHEQAAKTSLPPVVAKMGWISFFADVASEMAYPVLPLFLTGVLKAPVPILGLVEGLAEALVSFMKGWSGWRSDVKGQRVPYIQWGYGLSAVGKPLLGLATIWPLVLFARLLDRFGKGLRTSARDAYLADSVDASQYGRAFGFHRAMDTAGAFVGVAIALLLLSLVPGNYRLIFLLAIIPGAISVAITLTLKDRAKPTTKKEAEANVDEEPKPRISLKELPTSYWKALAITLVFRLANSSDTFLLLFSSLYWGFTPFQTVLAYAFYNVTYALTSYPFGVLSDRIGRWRVIAAGWLLYAGVYLGFAIMGNGWAWMLWALYGIYTGMTQGAGKALVADNAPKQMKGTAMGFFEMLGGLATLLGNALTGLLWYSVSPGAALKACAGLALLSAVGVPFVVGKKKAS
ncbi:MAG: MFS transporter [Fimbriimonadaceae bacterium]|nr:MFS transporter [Fimbriimonadaceae bacterium]